MEYQQRQHLSTGQKTGFVLLLVFALMAVSLAFLQLRNNIYTPFVVRIDTGALEAKKSFEFDETTRLQQIDTDHDGINDYQELFFYETSPYISDTDSDGIDDKTEIDQGGNPLCPEGEECDVSEFDTNQNNLDSIISPLAEDAPTVEELLAKQSAVEQNTNNEEFGQLPEFDVNKIVQDPQALRQMLLMSGQITTEELDSISDEVLLSTAKELAKQQVDFSNTSTLPLQ